LASKAMAKCDRFEIRGGLTQERGAGGEKGGLSKKKERRKLKREGI